MRLVYGASKMRVKAIIMVFLMLFSIQSFAQNTALSGKVTDASGVPLPGVTVVVKGTTIGAITDGDGNYHLNNLKDDATLSFSFVGMVTQEIAIAGKS
ncbi:MAG: carboxypeptidase-like regulatory domain-containing protein, partial [Mangrovibacterium sp.]